MIRCGRRSATAFVAEHGLPLVAKPRRGYASLDVYILYNDGQVEAMLARDDYIVQQFLGDPQPVATISARSNRRPAALSHIPGPQALDPGTDRARRHRRPRDLHAQRPETAPLEMGRAGPRSGAAGDRRRCASAFSAAGWRGPLNIQCERRRGGEHPHSRVQRTLHGRHRRPLAAGFRRGRRGHRAIHRPRRHFADTAAPGGAGGLRVRSSRAAPIRGTLPRCNATASGGRAR